MFTKFFSRRAPQPASHVHNRWYAIGDVHGCLSELDDLISQIEADDAAREGPPGTIVFLGDLVDRGPNAAEVVERAMALRRDRPSTRFIMGNHEEIFLAALEGDAPALRMFIRIGGVETIQSYGITNREYLESDYDQLHAIIEARVPTDHVAFLRAFEDIVVADDYAFVHAGIRPGLSLSEQKVGDLRWIRDRFLHSRDVHEKFIVHGHTITDEVDEQPNRLGIDTGAYASGRLTAVALEGDRRWFLQT